MARQAGLFLIWMAQLPAANRGSTERSGDGARVARVRSHLSEGSQSPWERQNQPAFKAGLFVITPGMRNMERFGPVKTGFAGFVEPA